MAASSKKRGSKKSIRSRDQSKDIKEQIARLRKSIKQAIEDCDDGVKEVIKKAAR